MATAKSNKIYKLQNPTYWVKMLSSFILGYFQQQQVHQTGYGFTGTFYTKFELAGQASPQR